MHSNVGSADRIIRFIIGVALIIIGIIPAVQGVLRWVLIVAGCVVLLTSFIGWCGLYTALGINTRKNRAEQA